jgi:hypothetical protein
MGWLKVAAVAVGALIVFMVVGTVIHLFIDLLIAAVVVGAIAVAIKAYTGRGRLPRGRRSSRDYELRSPRADSTATAPPPPPPTTTAHRTVDVDDDLARLKREMGR